MISAKWPEEELLRRKGGSVAKALKVGIWEGRALAELEAATVASRIARCGRPKGEYGRHGGGCYLRFFGARRRSCGVMEYL